MRSKLVILLPPASGEHPRLFQRCEDLSVQQLIPEFPVEGLDAAIFPRTFRFGEQRLHYETISHHRTFHYIKRSDNTLSRVNLAFLMVVALIPFSTSLIGDYATAQFPFVVYGVYLFLIFLMRFALWTYATGRYRLVMRDIDPRLLTRCKLITIGGFVIMVLAVGISFISLIAAFAVLGLLLVYGVVTLRFVQED